mmetsp:Transcript_22722/g.35340  ORF Transcript_22722/g.35340 Transcript_22722/m.35340 type:complete len:94 (+) Transcript_22722:622-903(+)
MRYWDYHQYPPPPLVICLIVRRVWEWEFQVFLPMMRLMSDHHGELFLQIYQSLNFLCREETRRGGEQTQRQASMSPLDKSNNNTNSNKCLVFL